MFYLGCDTTSAFYGKGKKKTWKLMVEKKMFDGFRQLGSCYFPSSETFQHLEKFVCALYGQDGISHVNEARYRLFKLGNFSDENLPPNKDCLYHHIRRVNYQTLIWKKSLDAVINAPDPAEHGWVINNDEIELKWMSIDAAPEELLQFVNCGCKTGCESNRCGCKRANLHCTELCKCENCNNRSQDSDDEEDMINSNYEDENLSDDE
jgi:hypothetical protein